MNVRHRFVAWLLLIIVTSSGHSFGRDRYRDRDRAERRTPHDNVAQNFESATADAVSRPLWFGATVVGGALFVVTLPITVLSKSVDKTAKTLVVKPAQATFRRPLGDFSSVE
jgi:hypothetical protein